MLHPERVLPYVPEEDEAAVYELLPTGGPYTIARDALGISPGAFSRRKALRDLFADQLMARLQKYKIQDALLQAINTTPDEVIGPEGRKYRLRLQDIHPSMQVMFPELAPIPLSEARKAMTPERVAQGLKNYVRMLSDAALTLAKKSLRAEKKLPDLPPPSETARPFDLQRLPPDFATDTDVMQLMRPISVLGKHLPQHQDFLQKVLTQQILARVRRTLESVADVRGSFVSKLRVRDDKYLQRVLPEKYHNLTLAEVKDLLKSQDFWREMADGVQKAVAALITGQSAPQYSRP